MNSNKYVTVKKIDGKTFIAIGRPDAQFDTLFTYEMARQLKLELSNVLAGMPDGNVLRIVK